MPYAREANSDLCHVQSHWPNIFASHFFAVQQPTTTTSHPLHNNKLITMADEDEIAALVIDNGSGMCKGGY